MCLCAYSVPLVTFGGINATWTRSRGTDRASGGRKIGGRGVTIVENIQTVGKDGSYMVGGHLMDPSSRRQDWPLER